jgi:hypothetical protein
MTGHAVVAGSEMPCGTNMGGQAAPTLTRLLRTDHEAFCTNSAKRKTCVAGILLDVKDGAAVLGGMQAEERKRFLEMSLRRAGPATGSARPMVREERADYAWAVDLPDLRPLRYMIVGGLATAL